MIGMHPGEYIHEVFVEDMGLTQREIAEKLGISSSTVSRILGGNMSVTAEMALKLEQAFGRSAESWLKMQNLHDLKRLRAGSSAA